MERTRQSRLVLYTLLHRVDGFSLQLSELISAQVWDAATGFKLNTFQGHEAPLYSVCPHYKGNIQVFGSRNLLYNKTI